MSSSTPTGIPYEPTMTALTVPLLIPSTGSSHVQKSLEMTGLQGQHFISIQDQRFVKKEVDEAINETTIKSVSSTSLPKCWNFLLGTVQKRMLHWNNKRTIGNENELFSCLINEVVELMSAFKAFVKACLQEADKDHTDSFQLTSEICLALGVPLESSWIVKGAQDIVRAAQREARRVDPTAEHPPSHAAQSSDSDDRFAASAAHKRWYAQAASRKGCSAQRRRPEGCHPGRPRGRVAPQGVIAGRHGQGVAARHADQLGVLELHAGTLFAVVQQHINVCLLQ